MSTVTFDTLRFVTRPKDSGLSDLQSVAITEAFREAHDEAEVATKADIRELELQFEAWMSENKAELIRWIIGAGFLQTALISALLLKLVK
jgi:hypothetical protein